MLLCLVRRQQHLKQEQQVRPNLQGVPKSPGFKDKAHILLASLNIPNKNCCEKVRDGAYFPTQWCHDDPRFQHPEYTGCSSVFWLRALCWVLAYSACRSLPARSVSVDSTSYCSHWTRCKELNSFGVLCALFVLCKGHSWQVDILCSCIIDYSGKLMFPFSVVPVLYFPSPGLSPVLSAVRSQSLISFLLVMQVLFLKLILKKRATFSKQNLCEQ